MSTKQMVEFWTDRRVVVTGGSGFVGSHLVRRLVDMGAHVTAPRAREFDLTKPADVAYMFGSFADDPDIVFHLAATVGGIGANMRLPATFLFDNASMNLNVVRSALNYGVRKLVAVGSVCAYPEICPVPFKEGDIFEGYPEPTNAPYGLTKRLLLIHLRAMRDQYGFKSAMIFPTNLYGPRDNFGVGAHVIPMLMKRFDDAVQNGDDRVTVWGTGKATRDFLYVDDVVDALEIAARKISDPIPINVGTGVETSIKEIADRIANVTSFDGEIAYDPTHPDGQPRRVLDISRAVDLLGWTPKTDLTIGLLKTHYYYSTEVRQ